MSTNTISDEYNLIIEVAPENIEESRCISMNDHSTPEDFIRACHTAFDDPEQKLKFVVLNHEDFPQSLDERFRRKFSNFDDIIWDCYDYFDLNENDQELIDEYADVYGFCSQSVQGLLNQASMDFFMKLDINAPIEEQNEDIAHQAIDSAYYMVSIPEELERYIDYEKIGKDLRNDFNMSSNGYLFIDN